ncbi:MAG: sulfatase-like hydrolase/transferase [Asgard group archaeon]|nr:sulfatase-like hydrolase/transferase [Asgard group archaeon]
MRKLKVNILLVWFIVLITFQLSFGFKALSTQFNLNNKNNIKNDLEIIYPIAIPESITDQILILFVDGLRYDKMLEANTPNMDNLMTNGTTFSNHHAILPSYSTVNYASFSTGASTNLTDVFSNGYNGEMNLPTLFSLITDLNKSLIAQGDSWFKFLGDDADVAVQIEDEFHSLEEGKKIRDAVFATIPGNFSKIQFIGFEDVDAAGHEFGAASDRYLEIIETVDSYIGEILDLYNSLNQLENTTIVLFSDHGHDDKGGHGGEIFDQTHATLILAGKGITNNGTVSNIKTRTNFITPTLLAMLGKALAPTMNGQVLYDYINSTIETKAAYAILAAEIMNQQLNATVNNFNLQSRAIKEVFNNLTSEIKTNITNIKNNYLAAQYNSSYDDAKLLDKHIRFYFSNFLIRAESISRLFRTFLIITIPFFIALIIFYLNRRKIDIKHQEVFTKESIIPQLVGIVAATSIVIIICAIFRFNFSATSFNSAGDVLPPFLTSLFVGSIILIFLPWLVAFLMYRKKLDYNSFKDWKSMFLKSTLGSIFFFSLPIIGYMLYVNASFGPWPSWNLFPLADSYAYMILGIMSCLIYIIGLILMLVLWRFEKKKTEVEN